jgi:hypothetical protein
MPDLEQWLHDENRHKDDDTDMLAVLEALRTTEATFLLNSNYGFVQEYKSRSYRLFFFRLSNPVLFKIPSQEPAWSVLKFHYSRLFLSQLGTGYADQSHPIGLVNENENGELSLFLLETEQQILDKLEEFDAFYPEYVLAYNTNRDAVV